MTKKQGITIFSNRLYDMQCEIDENMELAENGQADWTQVFQEGDDLLNLLEIAADFYPKVFIPIKYEPIHNFFYHESDYTKSFPILKAYKRWIDDTKAFVDGKTTSLPPY
ncbi:hypothetical protein [Eubacterium aggregans]|uniref:hypothetical protein n=1 Tax=Eubacterium aggregans TaxID=81409 RepID=UPI003F2F047B